MAPHVLAIDQGTTSSRAIVFDAGMQIAGICQQEFPQIFPQSGWVEHDPDAIWETTLATIRMAIAQARIDSTDIAAIGIANQRETVVVWDRRTGKPIHNAIVWQDRRTAAFCDLLRNGGHEPFFSERTGLILDPYFSGTKLAWILDTVAGARAAANRGELCAGTIDAFLIWRLTEGAVHATDATNASRTLLYDIREGHWDEELCGILGVPMGILPEVRDSAGDFGRTAPALLGASIPIMGVAGDQQAATIGQACFKPGMVKATYGTGCFAVLNTGDRLVKSENRLLSTIAYQLDGAPTYALEGSIFVAGAAVQWLRDGLGLIETAQQSGELAANADETQSVYLVPAFVGLGAPYWKPDVRGAMFGMTRNTGPAEFARAALDSVAFQTLDLVEAMQRDWTSGGQDVVLRVDGGMVQSDWTMQRLADVLDAPVDRSKITETTALGAAWLAGMSVGLWPDVEEFAERWKLDRRFSPSLEAGVRTELIGGWRDAVRRTLA